MDHDEARAALADSVPRLTALLRTVGEPDRSALGRWSIVEAAVHLTHAFENLPRLAARLIPPPVPDLSAFGEFTIGTVHSEPERDLRLLADRIEVAAAAFLDGPAAREPDASRPWLFTGTEVAGTTFVCHLLSETLLHGHDIARAAGLRWPIRRTHAALAIGGFGFVAMAQLAGPAMVDQRRAAGVQARYELRVRGGVRVVLAIAGGELAVEAPSDRRVGCDPSADPVALLLVLWGRRGQWGPIVRGRLTVWGRRPWLGPRLRGMLVNP